MTEQPNVVPLSKKVANTVSKALAGGKVQSSSGQMEAFTPRETGQETVENVAAAELRQFIERIERLDEERAEIAGDIKDIFGEAKGRGYDTKAIRTILRLRKKDKDERLEEEAILETYMAALGMV